MTRTRVIALVLCLLPAAAGAELYTVTLKNGSTFDSRYAPQEASWNVDKILLLTDVGNWISVDRGDIENISTATEARGFGTVINTTTIAIGWAPNDLPGADGLPPGTPPGDQAAVAAAITAAAQARIEAEAAPPPYSVEQFVEPDMSQGIPGGLIGISTGAPPPPN